MKAEGPFDFEWQGLGLWGDLWSICSSKCSIHSKIHSTVPQSFGTSGAVFSCNFHVFFSGVSVISWSLWLLTVWLIPLSSSELWAWHSLGVTSGNLPSDKHTCCEPSMVWFGFLTIMSLFGLGTKSSMGYLISKTYKLPVWLTQHTNIHANT